MSPPTAYRPPHPLSAAKPTRTIFDPWNSVSIGHQRAENRLSGSTSWRDSRTAKLGDQFKDGQRGGKRSADTVGAGSEGFGSDGRLENGGWSIGASGLREDGQRSIWEAVLSGQAGKENVNTEESALPSQNGRTKSDAGQSKQHVRTTEASRPESTHSLFSLSANPVQGDQEQQSNGEGDETPQPRHPQIFRNLTIYINGSTYPLISDHKLKRLLASHGARVSIGLGRRTVTHVILGEPNGASSGSVSAAGGGLASSKIQKEIAKIGGKGIKFVGPEWVLESVKTGKRLPEGRFANLKISRKGQGSVLDSFAVKKSEGLQSTAPT